MIWHNSGNSTMTYLSFSWGHGPLDSLGAAHGLCLRVVLIAILGPWSELRSQRGLHFYQTQLRSQGGIHFSSNSAQIPGGNTFFIKLSSDPRGEYIFYQTQLRSGRSQFLLRFMLPIPISHKRKLRSQRGLGSGFLLRFILPISIFHKTKLRSQWGSGLGFF